MYKYTWDELGLEGRVTRLSDIPLKAKIVEVDGRPCSEEESVELHKQIKKGWFFNGQRKM